MSVIWKDAASFLHFYSSRGRLKGYICMTILYVYTCVCACHFGLKPQIANGSKWGLVYKWRLNVLKGLPLGFTFANVYDVHETHASPVFFLYQIIFVNT